MFKNFLVKIFKSLSATKEQKELFWWLLFGVGAILLAFLSSIILPNEIFIVKIFSVSIDISFFSFEWSTYITATLSQIIIYFIIGLWITYPLISKVTYPLISKVKRHLQKKQS